MPAGLLNICKLSKHILKQNYILNNLGIEKDEGCFPLSLFWYMRPLLKEIKTNEVAKFAGFDKTELKVRTCLYYMMSDIM